MSLGEINDSQRAAWYRSIEVLREGRDRPEQMAIFPEDRQDPALDCDVVQIKLSELQLHRSRQWGVCWLACQLWDQLALDEYWSDKLSPSRKGTRWLNVFKTLVCYRLIGPGSEWRLHRQWYEQSATGDLLGEDFVLVQSDKLYRCLDKVLAHKEAMFSSLRTRWQCLVGQIRPAGSPSLLAAAATLWSCANNRHHGKATTQGKRKRRFILHHPLHRPAHAYTTNGGGPRKRSSTNGYKNMPRPCLPRSRPRPR